MKKQMIFVICVFMTAVSVSGAVSESKPPAENSNSKLIKALLVKAIEAYKTKDKETVNKFTHDNHVLLARKEGDDFDKVFAKYKEYFTTRKQSSFERRCDTFIKACSLLLNASPVYAEVPDKTNEKIIKKLSSFRYFNEPKDAAKRIAKIEDLAEIRGEKGAKLKFIKIGGVWMIFGF